MEFRSFWFVILSFFLTLPLSSSLLANGDKHEARLVIHLLDYLAKDYAGAVGEDGSVLSEFEYAEQVEFAKTAAKAATEIPELKERPEISDGVAQLLAKIETKSAPAEIVPLARAMQAAVLSATALEVTPKRWPDFKKAAKIYQESCALCHGVNGGGDGPGGQGLDPAPANFLDEEAMAAATPMGEFNTIRLGVPGTGMAPYPQISDEDTWSLAAYVLSLRHKAPSADTGLVFDQNLLAKASTLSDIDLAQHLSVPLEEKGGKLAAVRLKEESQEKVNTLSFAKDLLTEAGRLAESGDYSSAKERSLRAYLEGIEPIEARLRTTDGQMVFDLEVAMGDVRAGLEKKAPIEDVRTRIAKAIGTIDRANELLSRSGIDARVAFLAAVGILLREGFEAALIILSLLVAIRAMGLKGAAFWVHAGWATAVILGVVFWFLLGAVFDISGATREFLEGVTSLFAVFVLVTVGFWLHRHSEIGRWTKFLKEKVEHAANSKNLIGLFIISFIAVFREAIETVLFLRVIWFDADATARTSLLSGVGITLVCIIIAAWGAVRYSAKLPVAKMFQTSAYIMGALSVILTGKGVRALQESGHVTESMVLPYLRSELLGIYPTWETLGAQLLVLAVVMILWIKGKKPSEV